MDTDQAVHCHARFVMAWFVLIQRPISETSISMNRENAKILALVSSILLTMLFISACASSGPSSATSADLAQTGETINVNSEGEPVAMTEAQRAAAIEANRKVRDCRKRQRSTGSRIAREACGNVTSIFGSGIHVRNENNVRVGAGQESAIPED